jgi:hypothetical protein
MSTEALDQLIEDCRAELAAVISVLEPMRSGKLGTAHTQNDIRHYETRAANLRQTVRQLRAYKKRRR